MAGTIAAMPNIAIAFKQEISRVARKQVRGETLVLKKSASSHRSQIAELKRRVQTLEQAVRQFQPISGPQHTFK